MSTRKPTTSWQAARHQHNKSLRTKALQARPNLTLIVSLLAYLATALLLLSGGFGTLSHHVGPRLRHAQRELQVYSSTFDQELNLYTQLDKLLDSPLTRATMESYEQCLARGLRVAEREVFQLGFRYPDIRVQVMDWTEDNCDRLVHSLQILPSPKEQRILTWWAEKAGQSRQTLHAIVSSVTHSAKRVWFHAFGRIFAINFEEGSLACEENALASENVSELMEAQHHHTPMPFDFDLNCTAVRVCRLIYPLAIGPSFNKTAVLPQTVAKLQRKVSDLSCVDNVLMTASIISGALALMLFMLQSGSMLFNILASHSTSRLHRGIGLSEYDIRLWYYLRCKEDILFLGSLCMEFIGVLMFRHGNITRDGHGTLTHGICMCFIGLTMLLVFFYPPHQQAHSLSFHSLFDEFRFLVQTKKPPATTSNHAEQSEDASAVPADSGTPASVSEQVDEAMEYDADEELDYEMAYEESCTSSIDSSDATPSHSAHLGEAQLSDKVPKSHATVEDHDARYDMAVDRLTAAVEMESDWTIIDV